MSSRVEHVAWLGIAAVLAWLAIAILFHVTINVAVGVVLIITGLFTLVTGIQEKSEVLYRAGVAATLSFIGLSLAGLEPRYALAGWLATLAGLAALRAVADAARTPRRP